jgi:DNA-directed RNA polymerase, beta subunit/140 kD subunit
MSERAERIHFGSIKEGIEPPNLIEVQLNSYVDFLQKDVPFNKRKNSGLQAVFREVFPIQSYDEKATLDFSHYEIGEPKLTALEAQREGQTYSAPLHVTFQLKEEKGTKEEKVYMGEIPLMTAQGTFVINGAERVVVSQLHRSPGIAFESSVHLNGKVLYSFSHHPRPRLVDRSPVRHRRSALHLSRSPETPPEIFWPRRSYARSVTGPTKRSSNFFITSRR